MAGGSYYKELTISNEEFTDPPTCKFEMIAGKVLITNESLTSNIEWSYNGNDVEGKLEWSDEKMILSGVQISKMWFRSNNPDGVKIRVWAYL